MKYVLLDTCVLVNCTLVSASDADPELLVRIIDGIRQQDARLLLPDVVRLEYSRKIPEELTSIRQQTKTVRGGIKKSVLPGPDVSKLHATLDRLDSERTAAADRAQAYFRQVAADSNVTIQVPLDGEAVAEAISYVLAGDKPSRGPARGLIDPDSLIVASAARFVRANGASKADVLLVCSDNHKDFAQWSEERSVHILADSIAKVIPCEARFYKSPRQLLEQELEVLVEDNKPLSEALDEYDEMARTMARIRRTVTIDPAALERIRRATTIDPATFEAIEKIRRATTINPALLGILESIRRVTAMDPAALGKMYGHEVVDPEPAEEADDDSEMDTPPDEDAEGRHEDDVPENDEDQQ